MRGGETWAKVRGGFRGGQNRTLAPTYGTPVMKRGHENVDGHKSKKAKAEFQPSLQNNSSRMHPRNIYSGKEPDYKELAQKFDFFATHMRVNPDTGRPYIRFNDPKATIALTRALLKKDFNLEWQIPPGRLCPPVPNRLNYVLWLQDLLKLNKPSKENQPVVGIDIGTGANCIYPLLGTSLCKSWSFIATDADEKALEIAKMNVDANHLQSRIQLRKVDQSARLQAALKSEDGDQIAFCMCNPPFFGSTLDIKQTNDATLVGTKEELVCEGGEEKFVEGIIQDSIRLKHRVRWYTTMLGKKSSVKTVLRMLREADVKNVVTTAFLQGRTSRWGVGWCYEPARIQDTALRASVNHNVAMGKKKAKKQSNTATSTAVFHVDFCFDEEKKSTSVVASRLKDVVAAWKQKGIAIDHFSCEDQGGKAKIALKTQQSVALGLSLTWKPTPKTATSSDGDGGSATTEDIVVISLESAIPEGPGKRDFLLFSDQIKADIQRSNRRWRRLLKKKAVQGGN
eukprot:jgi/Bigna1/88320/estExt_fgenesh1_pg.C_300147